MNDKGVKLLPKRYSREPYAIAFRKGRESFDIINKVNRILEESARRGNLRELQKKHGVSNNYQQ